MIHACTNGSFNQDFLCLFFCGLSKVRSHFIGTKCRELSSDGMMISTKQQWLLKGFRNKMGFYQPCFFSVVMCWINVLASIYHHNRIFSVWHFFYTSINHLLLKKVLSIEKKKKYNFHLSNKNNVLDNIFCTNAGSML